MTKILDGGVNMSTKMTTPNPKSFTNSRLLDFAILFAGMTLLGIPASVQAVPLNNGQSVFDRAPRLVKISTDLSQTRALGATHRFTIAVPQNAGASLKAITITQPESRKYIDYLPRTIHQSSTAPGKLARFL